ncbi:MAG: hypothetical protein PHW10_05230 [Candidatus Peribacteraceae bacterium]|nr:hypothetical protein [Candidatus Peribacteraceae bacterium]
MRNLFRSHRLHVDSLFAERRLCRFSKTPETPKVEPEGRPDVLDTTQQGILEMLSRAGTNVVIEPPIWVASKLVQIPKGVLSGVRDVWGRHMPSREEMLQFLNSAACFFRDAPFIGPVIEKHCKTPDFVTLKRLTDHTEWIMAFGDGKILTGPKTEPLRAMPYGPSELLQSLSPEERQALFFRYVDDYIPRDVQASMVGQPLNWMEQRDAQRMQDVTGHAERFSDVLRKMYGMPTTWNASRMGADEIRQNKQWAKVSLERKYFEHGREPTLHFRRDVRDAAAVQGLPDFKAAMTSPTLLQRDLGPSLLSGALELGVIQQDDVAKAVDLQEQIDQRLRTASAKVEQMVDRDMGATRREQMKEAMTFRDTWDNMSGNEKLVLAIVGLIVLARSSGARTAAAVVVAGYFGQKFLFKTDDPLKVWSGWFEHGKKKAVEQLPTSWQETLPGRGPHIASRASAITALLGRLERGPNLETQARGLVLLSEVPAGLLAQHFDVVQGEDGRWRFHLSVEKGSTLDRALSMAAEKHGWKNGHRAFFEDPANTAVVSEAVGYLLYLHASRQPENAERVYAVEKVVGRLSDGTATAGSSYARLQHYAEDITPVDIGTTPDAPGAAMGDKARAIQRRMVQERREAADAYGDLVLRGKTMLQGKSDSVMSLVTSLQPPSTQKKQKKETPPPPKLAEGDVADVAGGKISDPEAVKRLGEAKTALQNAEADVRKREADVAATKREAEAAAVKPDAEVAAEKRTAAVAAEKKLAEARAQKAVAEVTVSLRTAEGDASGRAAEAVAARQAVSEAIKKHEADVRAQKMEPDLVVSRRALAEATRKAGEADVRKAAADAMVSLRKAEAELAQANADALITKHAAEEAAEQRDADVVANKPPPTQDVSRRTADERARRAGEAEAARVQAETVRGQRKAEADLARKAVEAAGAVKPAEAVVAQKRAEATNARKNAEVMAAALQVALDANEPESEVKIVRDASAEATRRSVEAQAASTVAQAELALRSSEAVVTRARYEHAVATRVEAEAAAALKPVDEGAKTVTAEEDAALRSAVTTANKRLADAVTSLQAVEADVVAKAAALDTAKQGVK